MAKIAIQSVGTIFIFLLLFLHFIVYVQSVEETNGNQQISPDQRPQVFDVGIAVNFTNGGKVVIMQTSDVKTVSGVEQMRKFAEYTLEGFLKLLYGVDAEFIDEHAGAATGIDFHEEREFEQFGVLKGQNLPKIHFKTVTEHFEETFGISSGKTMDIWECAQLLGKKDRRWKMPGQTFNKDLHFFEVDFWGHAMVPLFIDGKEVLRFHYGPDGILLYRVHAQKNKSTVLKKDLTETKQERNPKVPAVPGRNYQFNEQLEPPLFTRKMSVDELKQIALDLVGTRTWAGAKGTPFHADSTFTCMHFAFGFVLNIIATSAENRQVLLTNKRAWPRTLVKLVEYVHFAEHYDPYRQSMNEHKQKMAKSKSQSSQPKQRIIAMSRL